MATGAHGSSGEIVDMSQGTQVELSVSGRNLLDADIFSKSDPFCIFYIKDHRTGKWLEKDRTETIWDNLNPDFTRKFIVDYLFGDKFDIKFEIYDDDKQIKDLSKLDYLGQAEMTLDEIMSAKGKFRRDVNGPKKNCGEIRVTYQELDNCKDMVDMEWSAKGLDRMDTFGLSDPFLKFYRMDKNDEYTVIHRTEEIKKTLNPRWKKFTISLNKLCNSDLQRALKVECWDWNSNGKHSYIGAFETTLSRLKSGPRADHNTYLCINEKKLMKKGHGRYKDSGKIKLEKIEIIRKHTFVEYLQGGVEMHCMFAVDFGKTNKTLHKLIKNHPNLYQQALRGVGMVMENYDRNNTFPSLGFGADVQTKKYFNMNGHPKNPNCQSLDGVLTAYEQILPSVTPSGTTNMAPCIDYVANLAKGDTGGDHYHVLVVLTSGTVNDMKATRLAIVNAATLPLSIILVGIGDHDFTDMNILDGDDVRLTAEGKTAARDIVQFVPFCDHMRPGESEDVSQRRLARAVLEEVPDQLLSYMDSKKIKPNMPQNTFL